MISIRKSSIQPTARYSFDTISPDRAAPITLIVRHAGDTNPAYWNALIKEASEGRSPVGGRVDATSAHAARVDWADRAAATVVVGWENVTEDGKPVPCTPDKVREFLGLLIEPGPEALHDVFDHFRRWCADLDNFRVPIAAPAVLGKG